jgi:hypothetical protein
MKFGLRQSALAAAACVCVGAGAAAQGCIVVPPPDLAPAPVRPPRILHDSVIPLADIPLPIWPPGDTFIVPIEMNDPDPTAPPVYEVFVDPNPATTPTALLMPPPPRAVDGWVQLPLHIDPLAQNIDLGACHTIQVRVWDPRDPFQRMDSVTWVFGGSGAPYGCPVHDAGAFQDGSFPNDASADILAIPPEGGASGQ